MRVKQETLSTHDQRVEPGDLQVNASHKDTAETDNFVAPLHKDSQSTPFLPVRMGTLRRNRLIVRTLLLLLLVVVVAIVVKGDAIELFKWIRNLAHWCRKT
jgi:hypothetical protein